MGSINLTVHPLFFAFGIYYAFTGKILVFIIYSLCALSHELGHSFASQRQGYRLGKIVLMPFGAVVTGNIDGLKYTDQVKIALAGPMLNLAVSFFFIALWWILPELYIFTDLIVESNLSMAIINLLPAYPLDGGRVLSATLGQFFGEKKAGLVCKVLGAILGLSLFTFFIISCFNTINLSLLFFSLFVLFGAFEKRKGNRYVKLYSGLDEKRLMCGLVVKRIAVSKNATVKRLTSLLDTNAVNEVLVFDGEKKVAEFKGESLKKLISSANIYSKIEENL